MAPKNRSTLTGGHEDQHVFTRAVTDAPAAPHGLFLRHTVIKRDIGHLETHVTLGDGMWWGGERGGKAGRETEREEEKDTKVGRERERDEG